MPSIAGFTQVRAYQKLRTQLAQVKQQHLRQIFAQQPTRAQDLSVRTDQVFYDFSRQRLDAQTVKALTDLAQERDLPASIESMFSGEKINSTEGRAVLHVALRNLSGDPIKVDGKDVMPEVNKVLAQIEKFTNEVLSGKRTGVTGKKIKNIVAIGIGGSYLGPEYLATAMGSYAKEGMNLRFVANVDATDFAEKTADLNPEETMVVIISKTFTTAETMQNAKTARQWLLDGLNNHADAIKKHMIAVSTAEELVRDFGIDTANMFGFWDWVGGRYSATSAVGAVPLSLYVGFENFRKVLEGAHWMDDHFRTAPLEQNIPVLSALIDIWNINFLGHQTRALLPYAQGLAKLPAHTQQVEMESNGKQVLINGQDVDFETGEVVFGEPGTNGQHSFYQLIHQGTQVIPADFIGFVRPQYELGADTAETVSHHRELMTNFLAQPDALAFGSSNSVRAKNFPGNRPSSSMLLNELTPFTAGLLLAWTEHRAAVKGFVWGINSFDQFGVELGKVLGKDHRGRMLQFNTDGTINTKGLNASTATLLTSILKGQLPG
ncbi:MAG: glucose-6-phosphate isomerase [Candidatus Margulisiibacteriota bacterium]